MPVIMGWLHIRLTDRRLYLRAFLAGLSCAAAAAASAQTDPLAAFNKALEHVVDKTAPAVVQVNAIRQQVRVEDDSGENNEAHAMSFKLEFVGAGAILDSRGYIITSAHVLRDASKILVTIDSSTRRHRVPSRAPFPKTFTAQLVGEFREADLALIKIDAEGLPTIPFARARDVRQGQLVLALGSPEGFQNSVSVGIVSSVARQTTPDGHISYLQTDAAINPGSSGGPLVDVNGHLVGINAFLMTQGGGSEGLGFAISADLVKLVYTNLMRHGQVRWGDIGVRVQGLTRALAAGLYLSRESGVVVSDVIPGGPSEASDIAARDIIVALDGVAIEHVPQFYETMYRKKAGDKVLVSLLREGELLNVEVLVRSAVDEQNAAPTAISTTSNVVPQLGIFCSQVDSSTAGDVVGLRSRTGIMVEAKVAISDLHSNLAVGDVIRAINLSPVVSIADLKSQLEKMKLLGAPMVLQVERESRFMYLTVDSN
jgi:serine protease Do